METKVIDLTAALRGAGRRPSRERRLELMYVLLALWTQYLSLGALALYGLLRALLCPQAPLGTYCGPLAALWPASFALLAVSCGADRLLWPRLEAAAHTGARILYL